MKFEKRSIKDIFNYFLGIVLIVSIIFFTRIYVRGYAPEFHMAEALPLSIIIGLTEIAMAISINKRE